MTPITINVNGRLVVLDTPCVMGILNMTPDSFYAGSRHKDVAGALQRATEMIDEGAALLDVGALSTRPGADPLSTEEEWNRLRDLLPALRRECPGVLLSVDTYRAEIARRAADAGIDMVNDISAGEMDAEMLPTVAALRLPYVAMHMQGTPATMQQNPTYEAVVPEIIDFFIRKIAACEAAGIRDVIIDPGFGFGKTLEQNYELLHGLHQFQILQRTVLVGLSRKSMAYKLLNVDSEQALHATGVLHTLALQQGAQILRAHDVREARQCIILHRAYQQASRSS